MTTITVGNNQSEFKELKLTEIIISSSNPRKEFEQSSLNELAESIKLHGVIQPIIVRESHNAKKKYEIVCGERIYRASKIAGVKTIPVSIKSLNDDQAFEVQIIENLERKDVHPLDEAQAFKRMLDSGRYTLEDISAKVAKSLTFVSQRLKLNDLIIELKDDFIKGEFGIGHAVILARATSDKQKEMFEASKSNWRSGYGTIKEVQSDIEDDTFDLDNAFFDIADAELISSVGSCVTCMKCSKYNSVLFPEYEQNLCFDKKCFDLKSDISKKVKIENIIKDNPQLMFVCRYNSHKTDSLIAFAESFGKKVLTGWGDYSIKKEGEFGEQAFDLDGMEFLNIERRNGNNSSEGHTADPDQEIKNNIEVLKERARRGLELDREKIFKRSIGELINNEEKQSVLFSTEDLLLTEKVSLLYILLDHNLESDLIEEFNLDRYEFRSNRFEVLYKHFSDGLLFRGIRNFIRKQLVLDSVLDYEKFDQPNIYMKILREYFTAEIEKFTEEQELVAQKRINRSEERIRELEETLRIRRDERQSQMLNADSTNQCQKCKRSEVDFIKEFGHPIIWKDNICLPCSLKNNQ